MTDRLQTILAAKRCEVARLREAGVALAPSRPSRRSFMEAIAGENIGVIAEIKRRSPSRGAIRPTLDSAETAATYERCGACSISVLTDTRFFGGSLDDLARARSATGLPVLRKDFIVDEIQIDETRAAGADAVLLIVAVLGERLGRFLEHCGDRGLEALVEVHDARELQLALAAGARVIGVNNRDLSTFEVDTGTTGRLIAEFPGNCLAVAESGIATPADVRRVRKEGYDACLVGEVLMAAPDPGVALDALLDRRRAGSPS